MEVEPGTHISPAAWHTALEQGGEDTVLLDTRNVYETRIGRFEVPGAKTLDPYTRHFSDLPKWCEENASNLQGKQVLMYCTGGVRCEKASALLKSHGVPNVHQLEGGIERYLESFHMRLYRAFWPPCRYPDGGHFVGSLYVFDKSQVAGPENRPIASAQCILCRAPWEHYQGRKPRRCATCKTPVLVCKQCVHTGKDKKVVLECGLPGCAFREKSGDAQGENCEE